MTFNMTVRGVRMDGNPDLNKLHLIVVVEVIGVTVC